MSKPKKPSGPPPAEAPSIISCGSIGEAGYSIGRKLGEGRFSEVMLGTKTATGEGCGEQFAVKVVDQAALEEDEEAVAALHTEVAVLKRAASHAHVVALHAVIRTPTTTYLVMELLRGGEMFDAIISRGSFPEAEARALLRQLLSALAYCHRLGVVHRDLKPENVLFEDAEAVDRGEGSLKLIDFGYAALHRPGEKLRGLSGTPDYVAPEVLSWYEGDAPEDQVGPPPSAIEYDASCDIWSVGVILYILLCGFPPFYAEGEAELIARVREGRFEFTSPYWDDIADGAKDLISQCLSLRPRDRPSATEALRHPWMMEGLPPLQHQPELSEVAAPAQQIAAPPPEAEAEPDEAVEEAPQDDHAEEASAPLPPLPAHDVEEQPPASAKKKRDRPEKAKPLAEASTTNVPRSSTAAGAANAAPAPASARSGVGMVPGELIARIRQMRKAYAPGPPDGLTVQGATAAARHGGTRGSAGSGVGTTGAVPLQLVLEADGPHVAAPPSRAQLQQQGATFVRVPKSLFQDVYALVDAQRRGELPDSGEQPFAEVLRALSSEVQRGLSVD